MVGVRPHHSYSTLHRAAAGRELATVAEVGL
jgi:hypothetical protein